MKLYGKNPVLERIRKDPGSIRKLYLQKRTDLSEIVKEAKKTGLKFESIDKKEMSSKAGDVHTQGVLAEVEEYSYAPFSEIVTDCIDNRAIPVFLDGITDPQNLGSIIRNLACLGGFSIVLPEYDSARVNETVLRVASGGENHVKIAMVANIATSIKKMKDKGIWIAGAVAEESRDISSTDLVFPMAAVVGSEGKGIRPGVMKQLDARLSIPMRGAPLSFNAGVAAALFCYEISRRR